jgi:hypothetical protein
MRMVIKSNGYGVGEERDLRLGLSCRLRVRVCATVLLQCSYPAVTVCVSSPPSTRW